MSQESDKKENVVNLAEARRKQRTVRSGATGKAKGDGSPKSSGKFRQVWAYVQFLLFLAILAYMMQLCSGRHV